MKALSVAQLEQHSKYIEQLAEKLVIAQQLRDVRFILSPAPTPIDHRWQVIGLVRYDHIRRKARGDGVTLPNDTFDLAADLPAGRGFGVTLHDALQAYQPIKWTDRMIAQGAQK